jgi:hypothetical protein
MNLSQRYNKLIAVEYKLDNFIDDKGNGENDAFDAFVDVRTHL